MRALLLVLMLCLAYGVCAEEKSRSTGDRLKSDVKGAGKGVAKAAKDVGTQIGAGTKKAIESIRAKATSDIKQGTPGDGSARRRNEKLDTAKPGRK